MHGRRVLPGLPNSVLLLQLTETCSPLLGPHSRVRGRAGAIAITKIREIMGRAVSPLVIFPYQKL